MIAKKTSKNQITLPKRIVDLFPECDYFAISAEDGQIVLRPVDENALAKVQRKLEERGIRESDVDGAIECDRSRPGRKIRCRQRWGWIVDARTSSPVGPTGVDDGT